MERIEAKLYHKNIAKIIGKHIVPTATYVWTLHVGKSRSRERLGSGERACLLSHALVSVANLELRAGR